MLTMARHAARFQPGLSVIGYLLCSLAGHAAFLLLPLASFTPSAGNRGAAIEVRLVSAPAPAAENPGTRLPGSGTWRAGAKTLGRHEAIDFPPPARPGPPRLTDGTAPARSGPGVTPVAPIYYKASELTRRPQVIDNIDYSSPQLLQSGSAGQAILTLYINALGTIDRVEVDESSFDQRMEAAIIKEFSRMRFSPGTRDAHAVASKLRIETVLRN